MTYQLKYCKGCEYILQVTNFYKAGKTYQARCKPCYNQQRKLLRDQKPKKVKSSPFKKLDKETQDGVLKHLNMMPLTKIADKFNIKRHALATWKKRGMLVP